MGAAMKIFDIAYKDLKRTFLSVFSLVMMFGAPLLITGLLYFAFGGLTNGDSNFKLPVTKVLVVNLDKPGVQANTFAAGKRLVQFLQDPSLTGVLQVRMAQDEAGARAAVDDRQAGVALIIPPDFSAAATTPDRSAEVAIYQDPTLTIGPGIVKDLVSHFMDGFSGAKIASQTAVNRLNAHGVQVGQDLAYQAARQYAAWQQTSGHDENSAVPRLAIVSPGSAGQVNGQKANRAAVPIGPIMAGMIVFFVFFIGANEAASIVREAEDGTLARMFTTPTSQATILSGKFLGVVVSLAIQIVLLLLVSSLLFRIDWGQPTTVLLVASGLIVSAAGFGVMLMSFIKSSRQTGPVLGGVLTLAGMVGGLFTTGLPNLPATADKVGLVTPHGWALQGWKLALSGAGPVQALTPVLVLAGLGFGFLAVGIALFHKRFA
jgi:ABC-2 type transport system permease protein